MNNSNNFAPGIRKIYYVKCEDLPANVMLKSITGMPISVIADKTEIPLYGSPFLSVTGSMTNGKIQEKATLKFATSATLPSSVHIAFLVLCNDGSKLIIGAREKKFPVISYTDTSGKVGGEAKLRSYEITHIAERTALECVF
jgi:hypothetical protein